MEPCLIATLAMGAQEELLWQDPIPARELRSDRRPQKNVDTLKARNPENRLPSGRWSAPLGPQRQHLPMQKRQRGGCNGARIQLSPMKDWEGQQQPAPVGWYPAQSCAMFVPTFKRQPKLAASGSACRCQSCWAVWLRLKKQEPAKECGARCGIVPHAGRTDAKPKTRSDVNPSTCCQPCLWRFPQLPAGPTTPVSPSGELFDRQGEVAEPWRGRNDRTGSRHAGCSGPIPMASSHGVFHRPSGCVDDDLLFRHLLVDGDRNARPSTKTIACSKGRDRKDEGTALDCDQTDLIFGSNSQLRGLLNLRWRRGSKHALWIAFVAAMGGDDLDVSSKINTSRGLRWGRAFQTVWIGAAAGSAPTCQHPQLSAKLRFNGYTQRHQPRRRSIDYAGPAARWASIRMWTTATRERLAACPRPGWLSPHASAPQLWKPGVRASWAMICSRAHAIPIPTRIFSKLSWGPIGRISALGWQFVPAMSGQPVLTWVKLQYKL